MKLKLDNLWDYYARIESEILIICANVELTGFGLDVDELESLKNKLESRRDEIQSKLDSIAGRNINVNAPDQVASLLYDVLKLKPLAEVGNKHKFKQHSTSKDVLNQLDHEAAKLIVSFLFYLNRFE